MAGRRVLVTGAGSGIGLATAVLLHAHGASVAAAVQDADQAATVRAALPGALVLQQDLLDEAGCVALPARAADGLGGLDGLACCAGIFFKKGSDDTSVQQWRQTLDLNLTSTFLLVRAAIARMRDALNGFVIRGISSNIPFQAALLQHPRFCSGHFNTGFIAEEYPKGFDASMVPHDDPALLAAVAAFARSRYIERAVQIEGQLAGHGRRVPSQWVVIMGGKQYPVAVERQEEATVVSSGDKIYRIVSDWRFGELLLEGTINGEPVCLQIERRGLRYRISHFGLQVEPMVMTRRAAHLLSLMPVKLPPDLSRFLLSPMPGLLREVAVREGQEVKAGEKLAVIEAMKMENVLKAEQDGKVKKVVATPGASLAVDEVIVEFE